ncbi:uncharacterized protein ALTATR162_LOCUS5972 [Alternaria atra]|uniref:Uncharacterized protein n=1 Tax=Alternaria atra TaxID=119953 RepID=A0A8J2N255_9PLEO|nr:uncharacterized protein ALTATR162_LOCUS5972 [Alternaria atra]CAG5161155.1 unnamed protein product [Alternaria atra]
MPPLSPVVKGSLSKLPFTMALTQTRAIYKLVGVTTIDYYVVTKALINNTTSPRRMGRGAYDTTYVCNDKDSAAAVAIAMHSAKAAEAAKIAAVEAAESAEAKLIRSKKSRGILAARKTAKEQAAAQTDTYESEGDSDMTEKP